MEGRNFTDVSLLQMRIDILFIKQKDIRAKHNIKLLYQGTNMQIQSSLVT